MTAAKEAKSVSTSTLSNGNLVKYLTHSVRDRKQSSKQNRKKNELKECKIENNNNNICLF